MTDHLKYYLGPAVQLSSCFALLMGGHWVWLGIAYFPILAILDSLLPRDLSSRSMTSQAWANVPVWLSTLLGPATYLFMAWSVAHNDLTSWQLLGAGLSCAWLSVLPLIPAAHELYHARGRIGRTVARYSQVVILDSTRMELHVAGHHLDVATAVDSDTAARGATLYNFAPRAVWVTSKEAQRLNSDALEKRGFGRWSIRHMLWRAILAQVLFQAAIYSIGGGTALMIGVLSVLLARIWVETFNYFQHYGLVRLVGTPIERRHVWNHLGPIGRWTAFEITNHADHHINAYQPYYQLRPDQNAIPMPSVFVCFIAALFPPIWFKYIIQPALMRWDAEFASGEEKKQAAEQNRRAGWDERLGSAAPAV